MDDGDWLLIPCQRRRLDRAMWKHDPFGHGGRCMSNIHGKKYIKRFSPKDNILQFWSNIPRVFPRKTVEHQLVDGLHKEAPPYDRIHSA